LSEKRKLDKKTGMFQSHRRFWDNSPGIVLRVEAEPVPGPLRMRIYDENVNRTRRLASAPLLSFG